MRLISFSLTEPQFLDRSKDVTRRTAWATLEPGQELRAVRKAMGLKKGEKVHTLGIIRVVSVRRERLDAILTEPNGAAREGFPHLTEQEFVEMFCRHQGCKPETEITRIEFKPVETTMTDTATQERRTAQPLEEQDHAPKPPKGKGASRKRGKRTPEQEAADKKKKAEVEADAEAKSEMTPEQRAASDSADAHMPPTQMNFSGDDFPDGIPEEVQNAAMSYLGGKRAHKAAGEEKGKREVKLIELMEKHGLDTIPMDDENKVFTINRSPKVKIETVPKKQRQAAGLDE